MGLKFISSFPITYFIYFMNVKWHCREQSCELPCAELEEVSLLCSEFKQAEINEWNASCLPWDAGVSLAENQVHQEEEQKDGLQWLSLARVVLTWGSDWWGAWHGAAALCRQEELICAAHCCAGGVRVRPSKSFRIEIITDGAYGALQSPRRFVDSCSLYCDTYARPVMLKTSFSQISLYCCFPAWIGLSAACAVQLTARKGFRRVTESYCSLGAFALSTEIPVALLLMYFILSPYYPGCLGLILVSLFSLFPPQDLSFMSIFNYICMVLPAKLLFSAVFELITHMVLKKKMSCWSHLCSREWYQRTAGDASHAVTCIPCPKSTGPWGGRSGAREQIFCGWGYHTVLMSVLGIAWHPWHSWEVLVQMLKNLCERINNQIYSGRKIGLCWFKALNGSTWVCSISCSARLCAGRGSVTAFTHLLLHARCRQTCRCGCTSAAHCLSLQIQPRSGEDEPGDGLQQSQHTIRSSSDFECRTGVFGGFFSAEWKEKLELFVWWSQRENAHIRKMHSHLCFSFVHEKDQWKQRYLFHKA